jgi:hypothetical protein
VGVPGADVASAGRSSSIDGVPVTQRDSLAAFGEGACTPPLAPCLAAAYGLAAAG